MGASPHSNRHQRTVRPPAGLTTDILWEPPALPNAPRGACLWFAAWLVSAFIDNRPDAL